MKKIVFINQDSGYLMIDIVNAYVARGYDCVLITGRLVERKTPLCQGVKIIWIKKYNRNGFLQRFLSWSLAFISTLYYLRLKYRNYEIFAVSNPPFVTHLGMYLSNKIRILIYDIYPDAITELGLAGEISPIIRLWKWLNKKAYAKAERIYTLTEGMKVVLSSYVESAKIDVIPIWSDNEFLKPIPKKLNRFAIEHGLQEKFVVLYSGNIGLNNQLEFILNVAEKLQYHDDIVFLIIGNGEKRLTLEKQKAKLHLNNVHFMNWQEPEDLPYSLSLGDISIVSLDARATRLAIPSKLYNYLSVGSSLLCIAPEDSELSKIVNKYKAGACFEARMVDEIALYISSLYLNSDELSNLKSNALSASQNFSILNVNKFFV